MRLMMMMMMTMMMINWFCDMVEPRKAFKLISNLFPTQNLSPGLIE